MLFLSDYLLVFFKGVFPIFFGINYCESSGCLKGVFLGNWRENFAFSVVKGIPFGRLGWDLKAFSCINSDNMGKFWNEKFNWKNINLIKFSKLGAKNL